MSADAPALRTHILRRMGALTSERASWDSHWRDIARVILPRKGRFLETDANRGGAVNRFIVNNAATMALRTLSSGLMSGLTSPARPWFRLVTRDPRTMEDHAVKVWLEGCEEMLREIFNRSNLYQSLHAVYEEIAAFGTAVLLVHEDYDTVISTEALTAGQYYLATGRRGQVSALYRKYAMTVDQIVEAFGPEAVSASVRSMHQADNLDSRVTVIQAIEPNPDYRPGPGPAARKRYRSVWIEEAGESDRLLRLSGYDSFPAMCPRWHPTPGDVYGRSCAMDALEDTNQLQAMEREKALAIQKMVNPPLNVPALNGRRLPVYDMPGAVNYFDPGIPGGAMAAPVYQQMPRIGELNQDIEAITQRIRDAFYYDLWLMITEIDRTGVTATEIDARREEKLLMLGPVLEQMHHELLDPLIDRTFAIASRAGLFPPPPESIAGQRVQVQYSSPLAQAQRAVATASIERVVGFAGNLSAVMPTVVDRIDFDEAISHYAEAIGAPARLIRPDDQTEAIRADRARREEEAKAMEMGALAAQNAKVLSETDTTGGTALSEIVDGMTGL